MENLTLELAEKLVREHVSQPHLLEHALAVSAAMGAMARHFGADEAYWTAVGYVHDVDYEKWPDEHLQHTRPILEAAGVDQETIRAVLSHGWGCCCDVEPVTDLEKSLYTVDSLTGLVSAAAKMRPMGIQDLEVSSLKKKFKDKKFAAKIDRGLIKKGCELLGMDMALVMQLCIDGMKPHAAELGIGPKASL